jgi:hypothetical protein
MRVKYKFFFGGGRFFSYYIQHCFICRPQIPLMGSKNLRKDSSNMAFIESQLVYVLVLPQLVNSIKEFQELEKIYFSPLFCSIKVSSILCLICPIHRIQN